jgi:hypothetical protein
MLIDDGTKLRVVQFHNIYNRSFTNLGNFTIVQILNQVSCVDFTKFVVRHGVALFNTTFFEEWSEFLDHLVVIPDELLITGYLNFHLDNVNLSDTRKFDETLSDHGLVQHVQGATTVLHCFGGFEISNDVDKAK